LLSRGYKLKPGEGIWRRRNSPGNRINKLLGLSGEALLALEALQIFDSRCSFRAQRKQKSAASRGAFPLNFAILHPPFGVLRHPERPRHSPLSVPDYRATTRSRCIVQPSSPSFSPATTGVATPLSSNFPPVIARAFARARDSLLRRVDRLLVARSRLVYPPAFCLRGRKKTARRRYLCR